MKPIQSLKISKMLVSLIYHFLLKALDCQDDTIAFSVDSKLPSSYYFTPLAALAYANYLKNNGTDALLIFDDMVEHYVKEMLIFNTVNQPFVSRL